MKNFTRISKGTVKWIDKAVIECESDFIYGKREATDQKVKSWRETMKPKTNKKEKSKESCFWNRNKNNSTDGERIKEKVQMYTIWHSVSFRHVYFAHLYRKRAESGGKIDQQNIVWLFMTFYDFSHG